MAFVTSPDGTRISYTCQGTGTPVILVGGGLDDGSENAPLADSLAGHVTVLNYSRRGRGGSGDTPPYDVAREIDDLGALVDVASGPCHVYGVSSGGALALRAAAAGLPILRLGLYEVPYPVGTEATDRWRRYVSDLTAARGRPGDMLELFMRLAGSPDEVIAGARQQPVWTRLEALAATLSYDAACLGDGPPDPELLASVTQPTLVATGSVLDPNMGDLQPGYFDDAADALAEHLPHAERHVFTGQSHVAEPETVAAALLRFFDRREVAR